jgi:hypothetical protein
VITLDTIIAELSTANASLAKVRYDLLLWLKGRQMGSKRRAAAAEQIDDADEMAHHLGRAIAYEDAWRQIIWPGLAVQDGTLDEEEFNRVDLIWRKKAEELRIKIMGEE